MIVSCIRSRSSSYAYFSIIIQVRKHNTLLQYNMSNLQQFTWQSTLPLHIIDVNHCSPVSKLHIIFASQPMSRKQVEKLCIVNRLSRKKTDNILLSNYSIISWVFVFRCVGNTLLLKQQQHLQFTSITVTTSTQRSTIKTIAGSRVQVHAVICHPDYRHHCCHHVVLYSAPTPCSASPRTASGVSSSRRWPPQLCSGRESCRLSS